MGRLKPTLTNLGLPKELKVWFVRRKHTLGAKAHFQLRAGIAGDESPAYLFCSTEKRVLCGKDNKKGNSRFPEGMTERKATATVDSR